MRFAYHTHYLVWCEIGRTDFIRELGATYAQLEDSGLFLAVAEAHVRYHLAARYDDLITVTTRAERVQSRAITFSYEIDRIEPAPIVRGSPPRPQSWSHSTPRRLAPRTSRRFAQTLPRRRRRSAPGAHKDRSLAVSRSLRSAFLTSCASTPQPVAPPPQTTSRSVRKPCIQPTRRSRQ